MILLWSVHKATTCTPGTSAGQWLLWRSRTSLCYLAWSHPFFSLPLKLQSRPWVADNSSYSPSLVILRTVGGRPHKLCHPCHQMVLECKWPWRPADLDQTGMSQQEQLGKLTWHHLSSLAWVCPEPKLCKQLMIWGQWQTITHRLASLSTEVWTLHSSPTLTTLVGQMEQHAAIGHYCSQNLTALTHWMYVH